MFGVARYFVADFQERVAAHRNIKTGEEFEGYARL